MMDEGEIYDYARGLNAPYWIQEVKTKKGKVLISLSVPRQLSFFVVFIVTFVLMMTVFRPIMEVIYFFTRGLELLLYYYIPNQLGRWYSEYEIDGKPMLSYIRGVIRYMIDFGLNKKAIYQSKRVPIYREFRFKKINN